MVEWTECVHFKQCDIKKFEWAPPLRQRSGGVPLLSIISWTRSSWQCGLLTAFYFNQFTTRRLCPGKTEDVDLFIHFFILNGEVGLLSQKNARKLDGVSFCLGTTMSSRMGNMTLSQLLTITCNFMTEPGKIAAAANRQAETRNNPTPVTSRQGNKCYKCHRPNHYARDSEST